MSFTNECTRNLIRGIDIEVGYTLSIRLKSSSLQVFEKALKALKGHLTDKMKEQLCA